MNEQTTKTWHILGAGAIGCLWACHLSGNGRQIHLLLSPRHPTPEDGKLKLHLQTRGGVRSSVAVNARRACRPGSLINNLIVTTKATQVLDALQAVSHRIAAEARIILLLNGMGFQQAVIAKYSNCKIFAGVTTDGAWLRQPFDVVQAGKGLTTFGALSSATSTGDAIALRDDLQNPGLLVKTTTEIEKELLKKVMINAAINGLTAIHECRNGQLLDIAAARSQLQQLVEELQRVLLASNDNDLATQLPLAVTQVITQTADNFSSTYQDIKHRRPTEIAFINGYVCKLGEELGISTPCNQEIVSAVSALER